MAAAESPEKRSDSRPDAASGPRRRSCPTDARLAALSVGGLAPLDEAELIAHLDECADCRDRLETLDGPTPAPVAAALGSSSEPPPPALAALISRWRRESLDTMDVPSADRGTSGLSGSTATAPDGKRVGRSKLEADYVLHMLRASGPPVAPEFFCRLGRYDVIEIVGQGGMAIVLKARDASLQRVVAIKVLRPHLAADPLSRKRFVREGQAVAAVRDPHVIGVYAVEEDAPLPYLVMEYVAGASLQDRLDKEGPPSLEMALRVGRQIAAGLAAAHAQGLIHRDVKPSNVLLENGGPRVKISDFGLARATDATALTESGVVAGTPAYMSPEQVKGAALDPRSDLFSLGSVLYTLCTGRAPFNGPTLLSTMRQVAEDPPPPIRNLNAATPAWLADVIRKLHEKNPDDRFQTAEEVEAVLSQGLAYLQQPAGAPEPARLYEPEAAPAATRDDASPDRASVAPLFSVGLALAIAGVTTVAIFGAVHRARNYAQNDPAAPAARNGAPAAAADAPRDSYEIHASPGGPLVGHTGNAVDVEFSPDGTRVASCSGGLGGDRSVRIWDATNPQLENLAPRSLDVLKRAYSQPPRVVTTRPTDAVRQVWTVRWLPHGRSLLAAGVFDEVLEIDASGETSPPRILRWVRVARGPIYAVAPTPDGREFYAAGADGVIRRFDLRSGARLAEWWALPPAALGLDRPMAIDSLSVSPSGARVVSTGADRMLRLWDSASGRVLWEASHDPAPLSSAVFVDDQRLLAASDALRLYDARNGKVLWTSKAHAAVDLAVDARLGLIATAGRDGTVRLWDLPTGVALGTLPGSDLRDCVAFSPDGGTLAAGGGRPIVEGSSDYRVLRWRLFRRSLTDPRAAGDEAAAPAPGANRVPLDETELPSADGRSRDGREPAAGTSFATPRPGEATRAAEPDRSGVAVTPTLPPPGPPVEPPADADGRPAVIRPGETYASPEEQLVGHAGTVVAAAYSPDGTALATCGGYLRGDRTLRLWNAKADRFAGPKTLDLTTLELPRLPHAPTARGDDAGQPFALAFLPDGKSLLLAGAFPGVLEISASLEADEPRVIRTIPTGDAAIHSLAVAPDGASFYRGDDAGRVTRVALADGKTLAEWDAIPQEKAKPAGIANVVRGLAVSPSGRWLAWMAGDGAVRLRDVAKNEPKWETLPLGDRPAVIRFADDDRLIVCGRDLRVLDVATGRATWTSERVDATDAAIDLAHGLVATSTLDGAVRLFNLATGEPLVRLAARDRRECVAISPDGERLVAGGGHETRVGPEDRLLRWRLLRRPESAAPADAKPAEQRPAEPRASDDRSAS